VNPKTRGPEGQETNMSDLILYEVASGIATITLNRPEAMNSINMELLDKLSLALDNAGRDAEVRGILITGSGERAFSAGADIKLLSQSSPEEIRALAGRAVAVFKKATALGKPTLAAINGFAFGGGLELAEACNFRVAVEGSMMGHPEVRIGAVAAWGGTARLPRLVGLSRATELLLTGRNIQASEALQIGLVHMVTSREDHLKESCALLKEVFTQAPLAVSYTWEAIRRGMDSSLEEALEIGVDFFGLAASTEDFREGTDAFINKRNPKFIGR